MGKLQNCFKLLVHHQNRRLYSTLQHSLNQNVNSLKHSDEISTKTRKLMNGYVNDTKSSLNGSCEFKETRQLINKCKSSSQIIHILQQQEQEYDISVYGTAIQKCVNMPNNSIIIKKIMDMIYERNITHDEVIYNILFNVFSNNDASYECLPYLNKMIHEFNIIPNIIIATSLIGGCKKRGDIKTAEKYWNDIIIKYNLIPNEMTYTEMITVYANGGDTKCAQNKFNEMLENEIAPTIISCSALMMAYAKMADTAKVIQIKTFCDKMNIKLSPVTYVIIMSSYLKNNQPKEALKIFDELINNENGTGNNISEQIIGLKASAHLQLLIESKCFDDFQIIVSEIPKYRKRFGYKELNNITGLIQLNAALVYYENNFDKVLKIFNFLRNEIEIGYWMKHNKEDQWMIDLHLFDYNVASFILKYILLFEYELVMDLNEIWIMCGKGMHRDPVIYEKQINNKGLINYIQLQLQTYSPPIKSYIHGKYSAILVVNRNDFVDWISAQKTN